MVGAAGFEPATSSLSGTRSNQLSYAPNLERQSQVIGTSVPIRKTGGARRDRTDDLLNANQALSQLSYGPGNGF